MQSSMSLNSWKGGIHFADYIDDEHFLAMKRCTKASHICIHLFLTKKMKSLILQLKRPRLGESELLCSRPHSMFQLELGYTGPP